MNQQADPLAQPPQQPPAGIAVSGSGHTFIINQGAINARFSSTRQWYQQEMLKHGAWYWVMHGIVALVVVAVWEYRLWFFSFFATKH